jgi:hypothetical protein
LKDSTLSISFLTGELIRLCIVNAMKGKGFGGALGTAFCWLILLRWFSYYFVIRFGGFILFCKILGRLNFTLLVTKMMRFDQINVQYLMIQIEHLRCLVSWNPNFSMIVLLVLNTRILQWIFLGIGMTTSFWWNGCGQNSTFSTL